MNVIVTCGPAYEPIDQARRLSNFSTGRLGVTLTQALAEAGHAVWCLKGEGATHPGPEGAHVLERFGTNDDLAARLEALGARATFGAVFHAAALCDYRVEQVLGEAGQPVQSAKFATGEGRLTLVLAPARKVLPNLRAWFPQARIVGWKYELAGPRAAAAALAWRQIRDCHTDACVLNGAAYGDGFGFCTLPDGLEPLPDLAALCAHLVAWLGCAAPLS
jgi:phosphopantothenoylcysteine decarboxylase/phosphopantothenate--cysteine ligase